MSGIEDKFVQALAEGGPDGYVLVESKMVRGSTHDKDRTKMTRLIESDSLNDGLDDLRELQQRDMSERRAYDPEQEGGG